MWSNVGKKCAGLTDYPLHRKLDHGDPPDWSQCRFDSEEEAQNWYRLLLTRGYLGGVDGSGWRYGYTFTCTHNTKE
jgi:hypothetical protein